MSISNIFQGYKLSVWFDNDSNEYTVKLDTSSRKVKLSDIVPEELFRECRLVSDSQRKLDARFDKINLESKLIEKLKTKGYRFKYGSYRGYNDFCSTFYYDISKDGAKLYSVECFNTVRFIVERKSLNGVFEVTRNDVIRLLIKLMWG